MVGGATIQPTTSSADAPGVARIDDALLVGLAKRDPHAFAPLYERYVDLVYRYCYRRLSDPEAAADATAQVFAKALAGVGKCTETAFRSWLFAIAHNVLVDAYRARRPDAPLEAASEVIDAGPTPEEAALAADERRTIGRLLDRLTPDQRQVVELRLAGLNAEEIAATLGRSRGSVDTAQCRAIARLRTLLGVSKPAGTPKGGTDAAR